ncbi:MAG: hypothetical protein JWR63_4290, partial [Conexibacter sp.]|nr:hypothetical protein [Conexibacter sp.]
MPTVTKRKAPAPSLAIMRAHGIVDPEATAAAAAKNNVPLSVLCAVQQLETGGGRNVYGHDPVRAGQQLGGVVTRDSYRRYVKLRATHGCQGVGPMQLTSEWLQNEADRRGGCWVPSHNLSVGAWYLAQLHRTFGSWQLAAQHYNGSGAAAVHYGQSMQALAGVWHARFMDGHR